MHRAEHLLVRAPADRHPAGRRVPLRQFQRRPARHLRLDPARIALRAQHFLFLSGRRQSGDERARPTSTITSTTSPRAGSSPTSRSASSARTSGRAASTSPTRSRAACRSRCRPATPIPATDRDSARFQFQYFSPSGPLPVTVAQERPDFLLSDFNVYTYNIQLRDVSGAEGAASYDADLRVHAGYAQAEVEFVDGLRATAGVRYEDAVQTVTADRRHLLAPTRIAETLLAARGDGDLAVHARHAAPPARARRPSPGRSSASSRRKSTRISNPTASSPATRS